MSKLPLVIDEKFGPFEIGTALPSFGRLNIIIGANNSGKSFFLKFLNHKINSVEARASDYIGIHRFMPDQQSDAANARARVKERLSSRRVVGPGDANHYFEFDNEFFDMDAEDQQALQNFVKKLDIGSLEEKPTDPENRRSKLEVRLNNLRLTEHGTGIRSLLAMLLLIFHSGRKYIFIDEPEFSLESAKQKIVFDEIKNAIKERGKTIFIATHSHIFIDRNSPENHYYIKREGGVTSIKQITSEQELHSLVFEKLGNSPNDLFFPNNLIIVEGVSDKIFLEKCLKIIEKNRYIAVHYAESNSRIGSAAVALVEMLKASRYLQPYRKSICVLFDYIQNCDEERFFDDMKNMLEDPSEERVRKLEKPGIEYYYPIATFCKITNTDPKDFEQNIKLFLTQTKEEKEGNIGKYIGTKRELAEKVAMEMQNTENVDKEILSFLETACIKSF